MSPNGGFFYFFIIFFYFLKIYIEASIHAMRKIYEDPATEGILLIDASNALNGYCRWRREP